MRNTLLALMLAASMGSLAASAGAQPYRDYDRGGRSIATLYEGYNFQGRSIDIYVSDQNLSGIRFNDRARSARFQGVWRICEDADFGGRCQEVSGDVADLNRIGMAERISSLQSASGGWGPSRPPGGGPGGGSGGWGPGGGWGQQARGADGAKSVFFAYPKFNGSDIAAGGMSANAFCRSQGLGAALYYDSSERAPRAVDGEGRPVGNTTIIRDILCRRY